MASDAGGHDERGGKFRKAWQSAHDTRDVALMHGWFSGSRFRPLNIDGGTRVLHRVHSTALHTKPF